ncbi:hypothetical protein BJ912DRAFT_927435 [Pholiota molesta]|nr:hypothetical protein BJ912DRAFT_927435 [Pholiota molesta]
MDQPIPHQAALSAQAAFVQAWTNAIPLQVMKLFKIPDGLSPAWQAFFDSHRIPHEAERHHETRPHRAREQESEWKKGETARAEMLYFSSLSTFPTPDALNNIAACALKLNQQVSVSHYVAPPRFALAESFATDALDLDLSSHPLGSAKAHFRRAEARIHLAKFDAAKEDALAARQSSLPTGAVDGLLGRIHALRDTVKTSAQMERYLNAQPRPHAKSYFDATLDSVLGLDLQVYYIRIPPALLERVKTEIDPVSYLHHMDAVDSSLDREGDAEEAGTLGARSASVEESCQLRTVTQSLETGPSIAVPYKQVPPTIAISHLTSLLPVRWKLPISRSSAKEALTKTGYTPIGYSSILSISERGTPVAEQRGSVPAVSSFDRMQTGSNLER